MASKHDTDMDESAPSSVGAKLRAGREASGRTVEDIAHDMHMKVDQIEALERDDYSKLPDAVFVQGYIRGFARIIDLDPQPLLDQFAQTRAHEEPSFKAVSPAAVMDYEPRARTGWLTALVVIFSALLVAALVILLRGGFSTDEEPTSSEAAAGSETSSREASTSPVGSSGWLSLGEPEEIRPEPAPMLQDATGEVNPLTGKKTSLEPLQAEALSNEVAQAEQGKVPATEAESLPLPAQNKKGGGKVESPVPQSKKVPEKEPKQAKVDSPKKPQPAAKPAKSAEAEKPKPSAALKKPAAPRENNGLLPVFVPVDSKKDANGDTPSSKKGEAGNDEPRVKGVPMSAVFEFEEDSWVQIKDVHNQPLLSGLQKAGTVKTLEGEGPFQVFLGNAPGVVIKQGGSTFDASGYVRSNRTARFKLKSP